ncbi:hypothetical protein RBB79_03785 [Tunturiibacter empetritectus]|uniref:Uncharacterized protein n=1 Tax=Tunturiibacter lichenicola TaxID=2051959 RepID=A0A852VEG6_9BACT|nr:hypothetical protein [Edaphobacter lichenicola]NYF88635.1 hypothetical protein [Edaphobacter lichenicola]
MGFFLLATATHVCPAGAAGPKAEGPVGIGVPFDSLPNAPVPSAAFMPGVTGSSSGDDVADGLMVASSASTLRFRGAGGGTGGGTIKAPASEREMAREELTEGCESGRIKGKPCRVHWLPMLWQSFEFLTAQHSGNILLDSETRNDLTSNPYWSTYVFCVEHYRWYQWSDDTTFIVHDIGHPMMGAITSSIFEQNDPKARGLVFENNGNYWRSRLKAMAWSAVYSAQWKVGPVSEASIGNSGRNTYYVAHLGRTTNETGFQDFVITPVYGFGWNVGEDAIDRYLMPKIRARSKNRLYLTAFAWMTPCKSTANLLRWKPTYYRDIAISPSGSN